MDTKMQGTMAACLLGAAALAWAGNAAAQETAAAEAAPDFVLPANVAWVAGLRPWERPAKAPVKTQDAPTEQQMQRRLTGVVAPVPQNVQEVAGTGAWYVPLRHPGLHGPYDIRGWYQGAAQP